MQSLRNATLAASVTVIVVVSSITLAAPAASAPWTGATATGATDAAGTSPTPAAQHVVRLRDGRRYWQGQHLLVRGGQFVADQKDEELEDTSRGDRTFTLRKLTDQGTLGEYIRQFTLNESGGAVLETDGLESGGYVVLYEREVVVFDEGRVDGFAEDEEDGAWEITVQTLSASFDADEIEQGGSTTLDVQSNRGRYDLLIDATNVSDDALVAAIGGDAVDTNGSGVVVESYEGESLQFSLADEFRVGTLELTLSATDTTARATTSIEVTERVTPTPTPSPTPTPTPSPTPTRETTFPSPTPTPSPTPPPTTPEPVEEPSPTTTTTGPGFGPAGAVAGLLVAVAVLVRRRN